MRLREPLSAPLRQPERWQEPKKDMYRSLRVIRRVPVGFSSCCRLPQADHRQQCSSKAPPRRRPTSTVDGSTVDCSSVDRMEHTTHVAVRRSHVTLDAILARVAWTWYRPCTGPRGRYGGPGQVPGMVYPGMYTPRGTPEGYPPTMDHPRYPPRPP